MQDVSPPPTQPDARTRVLDAAEAIVQARGVAGLTLEAAARDAGVSKGGLLYHFSSKEALLDAMLRRLAAHIEQDYEATVAVQAPGPGRVARAMLEWAFGASSFACNDRHERAGAVYLASYHHDPALLDPIRAVFARMQADLAEDGLAPGAAEAISAAGDGLFMHRLFQLHDHPPERLRTMRAALERLLEPPQ